MRRIASIVFSFWLFFILPIAATAAEYLVPVGQLIGLTLRDDTVTVAAFDDALGYAAQQAGIQIGDRILEANGEQIQNIQQIRDILTQNPQELHLQLLRGSKTVSLTLTPARRDDQPVLGLYLREGISGVGTVTWYDPESKQFGALGHGVSTAKDCLMPITSGDIFPAQVQSVQKGCCGEPGLLKGQPTSQTALGSIHANTPHGVFGISFQAFPGERIPVAQWEDIHTGEATIYATISGSKPQEYSVEITKIYPQNRQNGRNFLLKVTDEALLNTTGGIVQGMGVIDNRDNTKKPGNTGFFSSYPKNDPTIGV